MAYDAAKIDEVALALLGAHSHLDHGATRAWKTIPFEITDRLHQLGLIEDPRGHAKSLLFTPEGAEAARAAAEKWLR